MHHVHVNDYIEWIKFFFPIFVYRPDYGSCEAEPVACEAESVACEAEPDGCGGYNSLKTENTMLKEKNDRLMKKLQDKKKKIKQLANKVHYEKSSKGQLRNLLNTLKEKKYISDEGAASLKV